MLQHHSNGLRFKIRLAPRAPRLASNKGLYVLGTFSFVGEISSRRARPLDIGGTAVTRHHVAERISGAIWRHVARSALFAISLVGSTPVGDREPCRPCARGCLVRDGLIALPLVRRRGADEATSRSVSRVAAPSSVVAASRNGRRCPSHFTDHHVQDDSCVVSPRGKSRRRRRER